MDTVSRIPNPLDQFIAEARQPLPVAHPALRGRRILVTGAGGSIGAALALTAAGAAPSSLTLLDTSEEALYQMDRALHTAGSQNHVPIVGSVCDAHLLARIFTEHRPQIIFHAAALKHVPLMELNPFAAVATNALGTLTLAETAISHRAGHLLLVSTDKAVAPHSIMGASKRIAELILLHLGTHATRMSAVRLCNVIDSQGSVLPLFRDQIANHLPLTVTHFEAKRHFISIGHAVGAILAALHSTSPTALFMPEIPDPVLILDLAKHLLQSCNAASPIIFTGLRPGEKLSETLLSAEEFRASTPMPTDPPLYTIHTILPARAAFSAALAELREATHTFDMPLLLRAVQSIVPDYQPSPALTAFCPSIEVHA
jgi:FlaA1/EpsC-like NDP-sugar epimerase